ncbi:probable LRR receptor-like serine/threonine-protein kinase At1g56140 [Mercurialis annua]|uniref:probable LRR receptor-like serine/threonine-protein kinase At1g56140 n=1 Tax=Mercurialis annua TaxID=3986 RepID=UPI002160E4EB|nr:probable LRR receptor-like serine/threonine-protein kinase At1g56140 [Mercurialis annua]
MKMKKSSSIICYFFIFFASLLRTSTAQNTTTTDPAEVRALNEIFEGWSTQSVNLWNISGDPCTGTAIDDSDLEAAANNPAIKCDCTFDNNSTCHIIRLRVYGLSKPGIIPETLLVLKRLVFLKLDKNYFTGPLPAFIGNLTALRTLSVAHNVLSGPIPKEIGNLKDLTLLSLGVNNFSGSLPPEIGNLVKLEQLYINSCGLDGEIPPTFANLTRLRILWAFDNPFTGKIPDFIGTWTGLTTLRLQGNSFEGPIPSSFSNLVSMSSLRISDLQNMSSTLDFIKNLKNLTDLNLRNALITDTIPPDIGEYQNLKTMDLGFNSLTGQIPSALFSLSSLEFLFLGNNSLSGTLPNAKSDALQAIDLSYNNLTGRFPSWVNSNLQLNLVANNFVFDRSNISVIPGLNCLQRNFPCNRNAPRYANFSIKSGGPEMRADGILFEAENSSLGAASIRVIDTQKWAVSITGFYADRQNPTYIEDTQSMVTSTNTPELYLTSRISPGSIRYYGLGLENGPYLITLLFAETALKHRSSQIWESNGRRVFDIYIQGRRLLQDFDISKDAGGVERAVTKRFNATVTENYLEIHLFWAGKGTCCTPIQGYYGPIISALSVVSAFRPSVSGIPPNTRKKSSQGLIVGISVPAGVLSFILIFLILYIRRKARRLDEEVLSGIGSRPITFSYSELRTATKGFSPSNQLGEGGYGPVFKGALSDGREVAVKQLSLASHQGKDQFITEIATISAVQHRNLVRLYGCCIEGNRRLLVYEYLKNKSLDQALFGDTSLHLDWPTRFSICLGTARGLAYLHEESRPRIVHRDVKASNILLDDELCPKLSDFGLAKLYDEKKTHISTRIAGTIGYMAPEYAMRGHLTEKADVFSFGVLALEVLSGLPNYENSSEEKRIYLLGWAWNLYENNQSLGLLDPRLMGFDENEALRLIRVALLCTQASPLTRPAMSRVVAMLTGDIEVSVVTSKPSYLSDWDLKDLHCGISYGYGDTKTSAGSLISIDRNLGSRRDHPINAIKREEVEIANTPLNVTEPRLSDLIGTGR